MTKYKNVIIAGGAGFLGSHLCDYYISEGASVTCLDNFSTGSKSNVDHLMGIRGFSLIEHSIEDQLPDSIEEINYDLVVNLASPASPPHYQKLGIETLMAGSLGTLNLLRLSRKTNARFFHASTSEVYGDPEVHPQPESYKGSVNCYGPRSMYDESKRFSEALIYTFKQKYNTSTCIARFFNTYGPRMDRHDGRVVSNFICQALEGDDLTVYGDGKQTRSFCYVDDLIKGIVALIDSDESEPINLGNPGEFTMIELAEKVLKHIGSSSKLVHMPLPGDDPTQRKPDISRAKERLDWEPKVSLDDGLSLTIDYFKDKYFA